MSIQNSNLTRYENAIIEARRMRAEALRQGAASMVGAMRRAFGSK